MGNHKDNQASSNIHGKGIGLEPRALELFNTLPKTNNAVFDRAVAITLLHEGYYSNDPDDPGGATKFGVSLRFAQRAGDLNGDGLLDLDLDGDGDIDINDIKLLTPEKAVDVYFHAFWKEVYDLFPTSIALKVFDLSVNMGTKQAHKLLQRAVRSDTAQKLVEDGIIGPKSRSAILCCCSSSLLAAYRSEAAGFYRVLIERRPRSRKYINGWLNRAYY